MEKEPETNIDWDIRFFRRYPKRIDFSLTLSGRSFPVRTVDYSLIGVGIVIDDVMAPLAQGDDVSLDIDELDLHETGQVAWVRKMTSALRVGILKTRPFRGSFRLYPLSDILIGLQRTMKTGILEVRYGTINRRIYVKSGNVISASSNYGKDRLGDVLLKSRRINKKQYDKAAEMKKKSGGRYTAILVHMGYLKPHDIIKAAELQTRRIIGSLFAVRDAKFEFIEGPLPSRDAVRLNLSVADLIFRVVKKNADVDLLDHYLLESVVDFSSNPLNLFQNIRFTDADRAVISLVDGRTTIGDIVRLAPSGRVNPLRIIYALLEARFLKIKKRHESPSGIRSGEILKPERKGDSPQAAEIDRLHAEYKDLDYYRILGVDQASTAEEIKKAYYRAARKYHPDMHLDMPGETKKKLIEIFTCVTNACITLTDPAGRKEYDQRLAHKETSLKERPEPRRGQAVIREESTQRSRSPQLRGTGSSETHATARLRFRDGKVAFWDRNYEDAARLFAAALSFDDAEPDYHYYYGATLGMTGKLKEAVGALNRANELKPQNPDILAELGHVYLKLNFPVRAKGYFDRAVRLSPSNARAKEGLKQIRGKKGH